MKSSGQGIVKTGRGEEQPADKKRAQTAPQSDSRKSTSREATRDYKLTEAEKSAARADKK